MAFITLTLPAAHLLPSLLFPHSASHAPAPTILPLPRPEQARPCHCWGGRGGNASDPLLPVTPFSKLTPLLNGHSAFLQKSPLKPQFISLQVLDFVKLYLLHNTNSFSSFINQTHRSQLK